MFCSYCGTLLKDDAVFCYHCGKKVELPGGKAQTGDFRGAQTASAGSAASDRQGFSSQPFDMSAFWKKNA